MSLNPLARIEEWWLGLVCTHELEWRWTPDTQKAAYPDLCLRCGKVRHNGLVFDPGWSGKVWDEGKPRQTHAGSKAFYENSEPLRVHRCDQCGQSFDDMAALARHAEIPHTWREAHVPSVRHNVVIENMMGGYHRSIADMDKPKPTSVPLWWGRNLY